jgi:hypothetical protein
MYSVYKRSESKTKISSGQLWVSAKLEECGFCDRIVACSPHAWTVKPQKPRNTHATIEVRVFIARCWVTHATVERVATPRPPRLLLRNAEVNTSLRQLVATQQKQQREMFSVRSALTNSTTEFSVLSAPGLYNASLVISAARVAKATKVGHNLLYQARTDRDLVHILYTLIPW